MLSTRECRPWLARTICQAWSSSRQSSWRRIVTPTTAMPTAAIAKRATASWRGGPDVSSGNEVLGLGMRDDDRRRALLRDEVELLGERDADAVHLEELRELRLVVEIGARGIAP